ncbi:flagellar basal-body MS-ring/collar protein FliF [Chromobacterium haemolyticum]|uniref:flagellar basal-body MS-ring/collar protein FliF n=1 Tax=Chromobacterium haemolyticum TaxID=394935 RepID=UPI0020CB1F66|nr:flagellar basal-body MS-ring/collar protein FliF [Chromobacterium haemolyticum]
MPIILLAIALTVLVIVYLRYNEANYKPIFGQNEQVSAADVTAILDAEGIDYRIHPDSGQLLIASSQLSKVRMLLAAKGVMAKMPLGLEQVDQSDPLGVSQFVQDVRFRRGLEAELAQSIATLEPVAQARVHLAISKSSSFVITDGDKSAASVLLVLKPGKALSKQQILAVINLVAGSVANLDPARVSVVDQAGNYLSSQVDLDDIVGVVSGNEAQKFREDILHNIRELITPMVGASNYKASVLVHINHDKVSETREEYGGDPRVLNEALRDEQNKERAAMGVPGSLSNRPLGASAPAGEVAVQRNAATRQYAYDRNLKQIKSSGSRIDQINVAVVLNNSSSPTANKPWSPQQIANVENILRKGLGINSDRGDQLVVSAVNFASVSEVLWWENPDNWMEWVKYAVYALAAIMVYWLVFSPLLKLLTEQLHYRMEKVVSDSPLTALPSLQEGQEGQLPGNNAQVPLLGMVDLPPENSGVEVMVKHLQTLTDNESERVTEVIKQWVQSNGRAGNK